MKKEFSRTSLLLGDEAIKKLSGSSVIIFGIGGVGSFAAESLARAGIGSITLVDSDTVSVTNINRQLIALQSTLGKLKTDVMRDRILDINPDAKVISMPLFFTAENAQEFNLQSFDYIIDAIDTVSSKLTLIEYAFNLKIPVISCMGAGNKLDPARFEVEDISKTSVCPLARVMRRELKARGIEHLNVVYSKEPPMIPSESDEEKGKRRQIPGSVSFVPSSAGLILAGKVILDLVSM